jgi:hypothetical protein
MSVTRDNYIEELGKLSRVNIEQWNRFVEAYRVYALELVEGFIGAPASEIGIAVGRARQALQLLDELQRIDELYNKIKSKNDARRT